MEIHEIIHKKQYFLFDAFGTLFTTGEVESGGEEKTKAIITDWRRKQLEYTWLHNQMDRYLPFDRLTQNALNYAMELHRVEDLELKQELLNLYTIPQLIDGNLGALQYLKKQGKTLSILSNGTPAMLASGVKVTEISQWIDHQFSVDSIQMYKPRAEVYQMALDRLSAEARDCVFFSSNQWDVSGASTFGLDTVWVNQYQQVREHLPFGKVWEISGLGDLVG